MNSDTLKNGVILLILGILASFLGVLFSIGGLFSLSFGTFGLGLLVGLIGRILILVGVIALVYSLIQAPPRRDYYSGSSERQYCMYCGASNQLGSNYCHRCGKELKK